VVGAAADLPDGPLRCFTGFALVEADGTVRMEDVAVGRTVFLVGLQSLGHEPGPKLRASEDAVRTILGAYGAASLSEVPAHVLPAVLEVGAAIGEAMGAVRR
jgi:hypothetical protein